MPFNAFLHTHMLVVILFLILFIVKAFLLFLNKHETLQKVRNSTKILDIVFGVLILVTGGYLLSIHSGIPAWLWVKIILVFVAIPLGIVGLKKHNKMLTSLAVIIFIYVYGIAETKSLTMRATTEQVASDDRLEDLELEAADLAEGNDPAITEPPVSTSVATPTDNDEAVNKMGGGSGQDIVAANALVNLENAKAIYKKLCQNCHGSDGTQKLSGASVLSKSRMSQQQQKQVIANGRGLMQPFKDRLTDQEMDALAAYTSSLKQNN